MVLHGSYGLLSSSSSLAITDLPSHILKQILSRLPIKTLVTSKLVCKSWLQLINDPYFAKLHQNRAKIEVCLQQYSFHSTAKLYMGNFCSRSLDIKFDTLFHLPKFQVLSDNSISPYWSELNYDAIVIVVQNTKFVNCCNGLLCFSGSRYNQFALVWNPITSEFITFTHFPVSRAQICYYYHYGLGFSRNANRFKLLRVVGRKENYWSEEVFVVEICTIEKECSWRDVGPFPYSVSGDSYCRLIGPFVQDALHWVCDDPYNSSDMVIVSFNFDDEKFGEVPLPPHLKNKTPCGLYREGVGVLAGCLFLAENTERDVKIWLMKEDGVPNSWTEVFSLPFTTMDEWRKYTQSIPVCYLENGQILMRNAKSIDTGSFLYNPLLKRVKHFAFGSLRAFIAYSPSLVSMKDSMMGYRVHSKLSRRATLHW